MASSDPALGVEQAERLGWVRLEQHRPPKAGRPSVRVHLIEDRSHAQAPPYSWDIPRPISEKHRKFAELTMDLISNEGQGKGRSGFPFRRRPQAAAYRELFPGVRDDRSACTLASRLVQNPDVQAVRAWVRAQYRGEVKEHDPMPNTAAAIYNRLEALQEQHAQP